MLVRGHVTAADVEDYADPDILALVARTTVAEADEMDVGLLEIDVGEATHRYDAVADARSYRLDPEEIDEIYRSAARVTLDVGRSEAILAMLHGIEDLEDVGGRLIPLLVRDG